MRSRFIKNPWSPLTFMRFTPHVIHELSAVRHWLALYSIFPKCSPFSAQRYYRRWISCVFFRSHRQRLICSDSSLAPSSQEKAASLVVTWSALTSPWVLFLVRRRAFRARAAFLRILKKAAHPPMEGASWMQVASPFGRITPSLKVVKGSCFLSTNTLRLVVHLSL